MYLNHVEGPVGNYTMYWRDIAPGVTAENRHLMLGGEISMWTDDYCDVYQCGSAAGALPIASHFYGPSADDRFAMSIAGVLFPRASVGAGSLWNYRPAVNATSAAFVEVMRLQNSRLVARGIDTCPNNCTCGTLTRCGDPY